MNYEVEAYEGELKYLRQTVTRQIGTINLLTNRILGLNAKLDHINKSLAAILLRSSANTR